jgi:voltage-gated potassium channel
MAGEGKKQVDSKGSAQAARAERMTRLFDWPVMVASAAVLPVLFLEGSSLPSPWPEIGVILNWASWLVFLVESVVMIRVAGFAWVRQNPLSPLVTILSPPFAPAGLAVLRFLRFFRLLRLLPGLRVAKRLFSLEGVKFAALLAVVTVIAGGIAFARVEEGQHLDSVDGVWWALTTVTTVGYGDLSPQTDAGRLLAAAIMLVGIGFVALITAFVAERFIASREEEAELDREILNGLLRLEERLDQIERDFSESKPREQKNQAKDNLPASPPSS